MATTTKKKYLEKFDSEDELVAAYSELEQKLGEQGKDVGELRKIAELFPQLQQQLQQYAAWAEKAAPVYDWYAKNEQEVKRRWAIAEKFNQGAQNDPQAVALAQAQPGFQWMTPQEQQQLVGMAAKQIMEQTFQPWAQGFQKQVETFAQQQIQNVNNQMAANTNVLWNTLKHLVPPEKMAFAKQLHEESLRFADPSKLDPMKTAEDWLGMRAENEALKTKQTEYEKKQQEWEKQSVPSLNGGAPPTLFRDDESAPKSRDERMARVFQETKDEVGSEAMNEMFPTLSGRR